MGELVELVLHVVATDEAAVAQVGEVAQLPAELEGLQGQLAGGRQDEAAGAELERVLLELVQHGQDEGGGLTGARAGHGHHVGAAHDDGHGLTLDGRGHLVALAQHGLQDLVGETCGVMMKLW